MNPPRTAFVLGGGGLLGAVEVGMLRALLEADIRPDLVLGTSVGALNGLMVAREPSLAVIPRLDELWRTVGESNTVYADRAWKQVRRVVATGTHLHSPRPLRELLAEEFGQTEFEDLKVPFQCVAAHIEGAAEHWFSSGPVVPAVMASAAVPGLVPPGRVGDQHYLDGGIVNSIPVGRAVSLGAERIYVLQVGRIDRPLAAPKRPWDVARVSFEIARRHRFAREMAELPAGVEAHVLPAGGSEKDDSPLAYRDASLVRQRIATAYELSREYLSGSPERGPGFAALASSGTSTDGALSGTSTGGPGSGSSTDGALSGTSTDGALSGSSTDGALSGTSTDGAGQGEATAGRTYRPEKGSH